LRLLRIPSPHKIVVEPDGRTGRSNPPPLTPKCRVPSEPITKGFRAMREEDVEGAWKLVMNYLKE
jgi:hypothetical protein